MKGQEPAWYQILQDITAGQIVPKGRPLVRVSYNDAVGTLLQKLADASVLSAIVTEPDQPGVIGFVDVLDLLNYVLEVVSQGRDITKETTENLKWEGKCFSRHETGPLTNISEANPYVMIPENTPLLEVVRVFATKVHRVAIVDAVQKGKSVKHYQPNRCGRVLDQKRSLDQQ